MAGMFCSVEEAARRLGKTEDDIKEMIRLGTLREFRDGPNLLLKVDEIEEMAGREGIELPAESPGDGVQAPPPLATVPATLETEPEEVEMEDPEIPDLDSLEPVEPSALDDVDLDIPELDSLEDDMPDLELPELAAVESDSELPALEADELLSIAEEQPPAEKAKGKAKAKKKRMPKAKKQPRPRPVKVRARSVPRQSFGQWFVGGLRDDSLAAIIVLVILLGLVVGVCIAIGVGANYAVENFLL